MNQFQRLSTGMFFAFLLGMLVTLAVQEPEQPPLWPHPPVEHHAVPAVIETTPRPEPVAPLTSTDVAEPETTDAPADSGVEPPPTVVPPESVPSLREAIEDYRRTYGIRWFVTQGEPEPQHLMHVHGWTAEQIAGLTDDELHLLHGASHEGKLHPEDFLGGAASSAVAPGKPKLRITSPATWDCPHCPGHRDQDWSGFEVEFVKRDGLPRYPCTEWTDSRGVIRRLYGKRTPAQVRWSWERTQ